MVAGSTMLGLALHPATPMASVVGGMFGIAAGAALGYRKVAWRIGVAIIAVVVLRVLPPSWPALAVVATLLAIGLTIGVRGVRAVAAVMVGATITLLAMWTAIELGHAQQTAAWPGWVTTAVAAAAMGMVGALALVPRHLAIAIDPVAATMRRLPKIDAETRGLCDRACALWSAAKSVADEATRELVRDGVIATLDVAIKTAEITITADRGELDRRITALDHRIATATDAEIRAQYQAARGALDDQRRYHEHLLQNRERLIARMHNHVAALKRFQLAGLAGDRATTGDAPAA